MGDVSNYPADPDLAIIMSGGENWQARMTSLLKARDAAAVAIRNAQIAGDIQTKQQVATQERDEAHTLLIQAKDEAKKLLATARNDAKAMTTVAKTTLDDAAKKAQAMIEEAQRTADTTTAMVETEHGKLQAKRTDTLNRQRALDDRESALIRREAAAKKLMDDASAMRIKYQSKIDHLAAMMATEMKD
jgi:hypothetical protein